VKEIQLKPHYDIKEWSECHCEKCGEHLFCKKCIRYAWKKVELEDQNDTI